MPASDRDASCPAMSNSPFHPPTSIPHDGFNPPSTARSENLNFTPSSSCLSEIRPDAQRAFVPDDELALAANPPPPPVSFQATTIAPSPPIQSTPFEDAGHRGRSFLDSSNSCHDATSSLRISTNVAPSSSSSTASPSIYHRESPTGHTSLSPIRIPTPLNHKSSSNSIRLLTRTPSLKAALAHSIGSASGTSSVISSPMITAMGDVTPLPSPLLSGESPGPWRRLAVGSVSPPQHRSLLSSVGEDLPTMGAPVGPMKNQNASASSSRRKAYASLTESNEASQTLPKPAQQHQSQSESQPHTRNRSLSEYTQPDPTAIPKRIVSVSGPHAKPDSQGPQMRREQNLAESRGLGEWRWIEYGGDDGDHEANEARFNERGLLDAMNITEGLLKRARSRWTLQQVLATPWVQGGIAVDGGIRFREEAGGAEVC
ncbi:hypothetical protein N5P37_008116 [Trichoderma harzianum]|nr:hypothetical protein N5P37_008116 [Trichoderma harzianum]